MRDAIGVLKREGTQQGLVSSMQTRQELYDLIEYDDFEERDRQYFQPE